MPIYFVVHARPRGKASARVKWNRSGKVQAYIPTSTREFVKLVRFEAGAYMVREGLAKVDGPVQLKIVATFEPAKSWRKAQRLLAHRGLVAHVTKPDWDNVAKAVCDALTGTVIVDDKQIVDAHVRKRYGEHAQVEISVWPIV